MINQSPNYTQPLSPDTASPRSGIRRYTPFAGVIVLALLAGGMAGYLVGKAETQRGEGETTLLMVDNPVIARRTIVLRGQVAEILDNSVVIEAADTQTEVVDSYVVLVQPQTNIQLAQLLPDGSMRDAGMVRVEDLQPGDRIDATVNLLAEDRQETVSITAWRDQ